MPLISEHLKTPGTAATEIFNLARQLSEVDRFLKEALGEKLATRVRLANVRDGVAVLLADSSTTRIALRFHTPNILRLLQTRTTAVCTRLEIKIDPTLFEKQSTRL